MAAGQDVFPCLGLIVSGGHTSLYRCRTALEFDLLGGTIDDAAGEAFDKVASLLCLPYPGGPSIQKAAEAGNPKAHRFPRPLLDDDTRLDFSFSGLKTAVRYLVAGPGKLSGEPRRLTEIGRKLARLPVDPRLGRMVIESGRHGVTREVMAIVAGLSIQDPRERPLEKRPQADQSHARFIEVPLWTSFRSCRHGTVAISWDVREWDLARSPSVRYSVNLSRSRKVRRSQVRRSAGFLGCLTSYPGQSVSSISSSLEHHRSSTSLTTSRHCGTLTASRARTSC